MTDPAPAPFPPFATRFQTRPVFAACRRRRDRPARRGGFTLIEMLIAVALVLLMMTLFAQVFGLASETVSARKGMAANDQKSRLLASRFRADLSARTIRDVVPFAGATVAYDTVDANGGDPDASGLPAVGWKLRQATDGSGRLLYDANGAPIAAAVPQQTGRGFGGMGRRRGYLSISENDPDDDRDDVIAFTVDRFRTPEAGDGLARGRAFVLPVPTNTGLTPEENLKIYRNQPAFDAYGTAGEDASLDSQLVGAGIENLVPFGAGAAGAAQHEIITFYLRDGNLIRGRKLIRGPETKVDRSPFDGVDVPPEPSENAEPNDWPANSNDPSFANFFDYAAYRHPDTGQLGPRLHDANSLENHVEVQLDRADANGDGFDEVRLPRSLGNPFLRDGAGTLSRSGEDLFSIGNRSNLAFLGRSFGRPREFVRKRAGLSLRFDADGKPFDLEWGSGFLGRYTAREQADPAFNLPGRDVPGGPQRGPYFLPDVSAAPWVGNNAGRARRGEEILVSNVHSFDVKVYDDALGAFVDLGHRRTVTTNNVYGLDAGGGNTSVAATLNVAGDYHADRLVNFHYLGNGGGANAFALDPEGNGTLGVDLDGDGAPDVFPHPFGNRFDTWHPGMRLMGVAYYDSDGDTNPALTGTPTPVAAERPYPPPYRPLKNPLGGDVGVPTRDGNDPPNFVAVDLTFTGTGLVPEYEDADGQLVSFRETGKTTTRDLKNALDGDPRLPLFAAPGAEGETDADGDPNFIEGFDTGGNATVYPNPNLYGAIGSDDEKPLRAIEITVRYYDVQSDRMREESFRHSLVD